jgi:hypothetical protein
MLADLCSFLEIDPALLPVQVPQRNVTRWVRDLRLERLIKSSRGLKMILPERLYRAMGIRLRAWNRVKPPPLNPALRSSLTERYRDEIIHLQDIIGRDLSHWLQGVHL